MEDLQYSDYNEKERYNILIAGLNTYLNLEKLENMDKRPFYRSGSFKLTSKKYSKQHKIRNWFNSDKSETQFTTVIFVEATPDDKLLRMLRKTEHKHQIQGFRIKFVSKSGIKLKDILKRKDPFEGNIQCDCIP